MRIIGKNIARPAFRNAHIGSKLRLLDFATADGSKTVNIKLRFPATESITVLWGDGTETTKSGNGIIDVVFSKTYAGAGSYPIKLGGAWRETTYFNANNNALSGDLGKFPIHELTNLSSFYLNNNSFTGDLSGWDISGLVNLSAFSLYDNSFTGDLSGWDISGLVKLLSFFLHNNSFTGDLSGWDISGLVKLSNFFLYNNSFTGDLSGWDISGLVNLSNFYLNNNSFTGKLPNARAVIYISYTNKFSDSNQTAFKVNMTEMNISYQGVAFSTANINKLLKAIADWYETNAPAANCTFSMNGANMGIPTGGAANVDIVRTVGYYAAAGKTATFVIRTS